MKQKLVNNLFRGVAISFLFISQVQASSFSMQDVSTHNKSSDCWLIIENKVFDVSTYIPQHPSSPNLLTDLCGKDATIGWQTKGKGRAHSQKATLLLKNYFRGELKL